LARKRETRDAAIFHQLPKGRIAQQGRRQDLPGLEEAEAAAIVSAREIIADEIKSGSGDILEAVIVCNKQGETLATIRAKDILPEP
jgi:hypothetical protein